MEETSVSSQPPKRMAQMKSCQVLSKWEGFFSGNRNAMLWPHFHNTSAVGGWSLCLVRLEGYLPFCSGETQPRFKSRDQVMRLTGVKLWHQPRLLLGSSAFTLTKPPRMCLHGKTKQNMVLHGTTACGISGS